MKRIVHFWRKNAKQLITVVLAFLVAGVMLNVNLTDFQANLLGGKKSAPFDGTTYPVKKVPNWVDLSTSEWKLPYDQIPQNKFIDIPQYLPSQLTIPFSSLNFSKPADKSIRNAQVTYSTPYMGNYKLDGQEYAGSHLAVDIKIPSGTPIYAIANGIVEKAANQPGGFGNHIVLRHDSVPSLDNQSVLTTYYSGYGHMSSLSVAEGDSVSKGQLIGYSGNSGTTTTPHLHFQIDNDQAPWHIYWPFTTKEASDAGLSFWDAVSAGLNKDKALATTISPVAYVQKYLNYQGNSSVTPTVTTPVETNTGSISTTTANTTGTSNVNDMAESELPPIDSVETTPNTPVNVTSQPSVSFTPALASLELKYNSSFKVGTPLNFKVLALDSSGNLITNYKPSSELYIKVENGSATLPKSYLAAGDFQNGVAEFTVTPTAEFGIRVSVMAGEIVRLSDVIQESGFTDLNETDESWVAVNFLKDNDIVRGYPDGSFKPNNKVTRVEALKFIYEGLNKEVNSRVVLEFSDTDSKAWYARYISAAQKEGVVKGYSGNLFKPANSVTKAEFTKMLVEASGFNAKDYVPLTALYNDVSRKDWFYGYIALAKDKNLLDTSSNLFHPNDQISRAQVAQILYKVILMKAGGKLKYENTLVVNEDDLADFFKRV